MQVTIEWCRQLDTIKQYKYFIFLNSSVRGPFYPSYLPPSWQWTQVFTDRIDENVKLVGSSLVCLPPTDLGGPGPRVTIDNLCFCYKHALRCHNFMCTVAATYVDAHVDQHILVPIWLHYHSSAGILCNLRNLCIVQIILRKYSTSHILQMRSDSVRVGGVLGLWRG